MEYPRDIYLRTRIQETCFPVRARDSMQTCFLLTVKIAFAIIVSALNSSCDLYELVNNRYPTYASLHDSGEPGNWIPTFLPSSSLEIIETHSIDRSAVWISFFFDKKDFGSIAADCRPMPYREVPLPKREYTKANWWPDDLFQSELETDSKREKHKYLFFACKHRASDKEEGIVAVMVDGEKAKAYYWRN